MSGIEHDSQSRAAVNSIFLQKPVDVHHLLNTFRELRGRLTRDQFRSNRSRSVSY
jgi:hypothetical protein